MGRKLADLRVHAFGPRPVVGKHRRTLCASLPAEGPSSLRASEDASQVTCRACLRRLG